MVFVCFSGCFETTTEDSVLIIKYSKQSDLDEIDFNLSIYSQDVKIESNNIVAKAGDTIYREKNPTGVYNISIRWNNIVYSFEYEFRFSYILYIKAENGNLSHSIVTP